MDEGFWMALETLVAECPIVIDRPAGSAHPRYPAYIYPLDYGYLQNTTAADGGGIDVWVGARGGRQVVGVVCTVDAYKRDAEIKLLLGCTRAEAEIVCGVHNREAQKGLLIWRDAAQEE
ncbi:MAG: inorganic pyrophosphatase [Anaerolineae bacterium]|nr:inorganic pyrophosphatase [Anaerolineae bacterium]